MITVEMITDKPIVDVMKPEPEDKRTSFQVSRKTADDFRKRCDSFEIGRSMYDVGNRLVLWWLRQPTLFQLAILNDIPPGMESAVADALTVMAREYRQRDAARRGEPGPPRTFPEQLIHDVAAENGVAPAVAHSIVVSYFMGMAGPRNPPESTPTVPVKMGDDVIEVDPASHLHVSKEHQEPTRRRKPKRDGHPR